MKIILAAVAALTLFSGTASAKELGCLAGTIWGEARGESLTGQRAVAHVILNRVREPGFPSSVCGVVFARGQFHGAAGRAPAGPVGDRARQVAREALKGSSDDPTAGATHFCNCRGKPSWARGLAVVTRIGNHLFLRHP